MAKVFLDAGDVFLISGPATIFGSTGVEKLQIASGATGVQLDSAVERIELAGASTAYNYKIEGTQITVYSGATAVASFAGGNNPTLAFSNGSAAIAMTGLNTATLGGVALPLVAGPIVPAVNAADPSTVAPPAPVVTPINFPLTTGADIPVMTTGNDTITGAGAAYGTGDVISDPSSTDQDILTINLTAGNTVTPSVVSNVEKIDVNITNFADQTFDAAGIVGTGTTITVNNLQVAGATGFNVTNLASGATVTAGSGVTGTVKVTTVAGSTGLTLNKGTAATQQVLLTGTAGTDTASVKAAGTVALTTNNTNQVEKITATGNGAAVTYTVTGTVDAWTLTGDQSVTLSGAAGDFTTKTVTDSTTAGTTTLKVTTSATADLSKAAVDILELGAAAAGHTYTVRPSQEVKITTAVGGIVSFAANDNTTTNITNAALTVDLGVATVGNITIDNSGADKISAVTLKNSTANQTVDLIATATADVTATGTKNLTLAATSTAKSLSATGLSGVLTTTFDGTNDIATVIGGSGDDIFNVTGTSTAKIDGGTGTANKVVFDASQVANGLTLSNIQILALDDGADTTNVIDFKASQLSGKSYIVVGLTAAGPTINDTITINENNSIDTTTIDLSKLVIDSAAVGSITVDGTKKTGDFGVNTALTITGSSISNIITGDGGADSITGGAAADTLDGAAGADVITAGAGNDSISGGAGNDTIFADAGNDSIYGGAGADKITVGAGTDVIQQKAIGDSGTFTKAVNATTTVSTTAFDVITGVAAGDIVALTTAAGGTSDYSGAVSATAANNQLVTAAVTSNDLSAAAITADNSVAFIKGTYDATANTFLGSATGVDTLMVYDSNATAGASSYEAIVLVGFAGTGTPGTGIVTLA